MTYPLSATVVPSGPITVGADGALWLIADVAVGFAPVSVWRVSTSGAATMEYTISPAPQFLACTTGPDGAVWFAANGAIGRITPSGSVKLFALPTNASVAAMTAGPDGAVWFTDNSTQALGRITTTGAVTEFPSTLVPHVAVGGITTGSDGALWFTSFLAAEDSAGFVSTNDRIGRYSPATGFTSFAVTPGSAPGAIAAGPDGALWYAEISAARIGRITTAGVFSEHSLSEVATAITRGPDNALWFTLNNAVGEITAAGTVTSTPVPSQDFPSGGSGIAATSDGSLWLTGSGGGVVHFTP